MLAPGKVGSENLDLHFQAGTSLKSRQWMAGGQGPSGGHTGTQQAAKQAFGRTGCARTLDSQRAWDDSTGGGQTSFSQPTFTEPTFTEPPFT